MVSFNVRSPPNNPRFPSSNLADNTGQSSFRPENTDSGTLKSVPRIMLHARFRRLGYSRIEYFDSLAGLPSPSLNEILTPLPFEGKARNNCVPCVQVVAVDWIFFDI